MKPGNVVKVIPEEKWRKAAVVFLELPTVIMQGKFPEKKQIPAEEVGFVISVPDDKEKMFDWLIEVAFPDFKLQGWVQKTDLVLVSP